MIDVPTTLGQIKTALAPLAGSDSDYTPLLEKAAERSVVLLGEASHGTHDFYQMRADITRHLIEEQGLDAVVVEGDWPDVYRINRFVRGLDGDESARAALGDFERFPLWMWRNTVMESFIGWLRDWNLERAPAERVGIYGMDLYSMYRSADAVVNYLEKVDPPAAQRARQRYACLDQHGDPQRYGYQAAMGLSESCQQAALEQLLEILEARNQWLRKARNLSEDELFYAERNARIVHHAEAYYRGMFFSGVNTWNLRDRHMVDTLLDLRQHLAHQRGRPARIAVWAHNSHLGDARATDAALHEEVNVGQLVREKMGGESLLVGFTTYTGHVTAAPDWDEPAEHRWVRPALEGSVEALFHRAGAGRFYLDMAALDADALNETLLERAIGVIYRPETERQSHYFRARVHRQFDAIFHLDETRALEPLDMTEGWEEREPPETWPYGT
ncbi:erythromycin esterase family protein [Microbulbifer yueqingensis]|uniref:Erythromycin esterase homolog n=1 Tax=Microbulbifer yueqingensis TaxID=658219 RepID=A0A1G8ULQ4_9GAMM|nr:erythromycin esterase family protein [Microbulbifer yueqingensis]SDJ54713.1 Erythromycin esterase homolog [Microbulbifer yueqingensis]